jgi:hypothetical protein
MTAECEEPVLPIDPLLWQAVMGFLMRRQTGRVTLHVESGIVQKVEATEFFSRRKQKSVAVSESLRVESR